MPCLQPASVRNSEVCKLRRKAVQRAIKLSASCQPASKRRSIKRRPESLRAYVEQGVSVTDEPPARVGSHFDGRRGRASSGHGRQPVRHSIPFSHARPSPPLRCARAQNPARAGRFGPPPTPWQRRAPARILTNPRSPTARRSRVVVGASPATGCGALGTAGPARRAPRPSAMLRGFDHGGARRSHGWARTT